MKKRFFNLFAVALVLVFSSFSKSSVAYYLYYDGSGSQKELNNYSTPSLWIPAREEDGPALLNWIRVYDNNWNGVSDEELTAAFDACNVVYPSFNTLNDEVSETAGFDLFNL